MLPVCSICCYLNTTNKPSTSKETVTQNPENMERVCRQRPLISIDSYLKNSKNIEVTCWGYDLSFRRSWGKGREKCEDRRNKTLSTALAQDQMGIAWL